MKKQALTDVEEVGFDEVAFKDDDSQEGETAQLIKPSLVGLPQQRAATFRRKQLAWKLIVAGAGLAALIIVATTILLHYTGQGRSRLTNAQRNALISMPDIRNRTLMQETWKQQNNKWDGPEIESVNAENLKQRSDCIKAKSCRTNQDKIILIQDFDHIMTVRGRKFSGGEGVWARSSLHGLQASGFTLVYHDVPIPSLKTLVPERYGTWNNIHAVLVAGWQFQHCTQNATNACFKTQSNPLGIPLWKILTFHFWKRKNHPLGDDWTLAPYNYTSEGVKSRFLGYDVSAQCHKATYQPHFARFGSLSKENAGLKLGGSRACSKDFKPEYCYRKTAFILAKHLWYLKPHSGRAWDFHVYQHAYRSLNIRFELGAKDDGLVKPSDLTYLHRVPGMFYNHGMLRPQVFYEALSTHSVLIGDGSPKISPTPYDALCLGIPFINPILEWDRANPQDQSKWVTQHNPLLAFSPPHVYHVFKGDKIGFTEALRGALDNPINSFVDPEMQQTKIDQRWKSILAEDRLAKARQVAADDPEVARYIIE